MIQLFMWKDGKAEGGSKDLIGLFTDVRHARTQVEYNEDFYNSYEMLEVTEASRSLKAIVVGRGVFLHGRWVEISEITKSPTHFETIRPSTKIRSCNSATAEQGPAHGTGQPIYELVLDDIAKRANMGAERYGEYLKAWNGRDALVDLYQELIDAVMYAKQMLEERENGNG